MLQEPKLHRHHGLTKTKICGDMWWLIDFAKIATLKVSSRRTNAPSRSLEMESRVPNHLAYCGILLKKNGTKSDNQVNDLSSFHNQVSCLARCNWKPPILKVTDSRSTKELQLQQFIWWGCSSVVESMKRKVVPGLLADALTTLRIAAKTRNIAETKLSFALNIILNHSALSSGKQT